MEGALWDPDKYETGCSEAERCTLCVPVHREVSTGSRGEPRTLIATMMKFASRDEAGDKLVALLAPG